MSRWFLGCGILALVGAVIVGWFAYNFVGKITESNTVDHEARARYREASLANPFTLKDGAPFDDARLEIYLAARRAAAEAARRHLAEVEAKSGPSRLTAMYRGYAETARAHAIALEEGGMSVDEYRFFDQEIAVLLAEGVEALFPLRDARTALVRRLESFDARNVSRLADFPLLPLVRSGRIVIPDSDRRRLTEKAADLVATSDVFLIELFADLAGSFEFGE